MKILALDFGKKRIGVAVADSVFRICFARPFLANDAQMWQNLKKLITTEKIEQIVVGLPLQKSGQKDEIANLAEKFSEEVFAKTGVATELVDERFTTHLALGKLADNGYSERSGKSKEKEKRVQENKDSLAACEILETYLQKNK